MQLLNHQKKLKKILSKYTASIGYKPLSDEVDYSTKTLPIHVFEKTIALPYDKNSDPFIWANTCKGKYKDMVTCVLVPGREFDIYGTRHGRGYGWYDRFLSRIPTEWTRIGITDVSNLFFNRLINQPWDEPVDWILALETSTSSWKAYETRARHKYKF